MPDHEPGTGWLARLARESGGGGVLILAAAGKECEAVAAPFGRPPPGELWRVVELAPGVELVRTGVGPSNAAGAAARCADPSRHAGLLSVGVAGALPLVEGGLGVHHAPIGSVVVATAAVFGDAGLETPGGFVDQSGFGFPAGEGLAQGGAWGASMPLDAGWVGAIGDALRGGLGGEVVRSAPVATVSAGSGTDSRAADVSARTGAVAEAMEGASIALVAHRLGLRAGEVRVVSNTTGDRDRQRWDLGGALDVLRRVMALG